MYITLFSIQIFACYLFYASSRRAKLAPKQLWLEKATANTKLIRLISSVILFVTGVLLLVDLGIGSSFFVFFTCLMTAFSLIILLAPYNILGRNTITFMFCLLLSLELFVF